MTDREGTTEHRMQRRGEMNEWRKPLNRERELIYIEKSPKVAGVSETERGKRGTRVTVMDGGDRHRDG